MTWKEFLELWPLWTYLFGFATTFMGQVAREAYNDRHECLDGEDMFKIAGIASIWPLTAMYYGGVGGGLYLKARKERILEEKREKKRLADQHAKLLKEAGFQP